MKNKKGFTLVELLAVIVVLGIILAIAIPNIINLITQARNDVYLRQNDLIVDAAGKYVLQNEKNIVWTNDTATIYLKDLQNSNLLDNPLNDPRGGQYNNTVPNGTRITVTRNNNQYTYDLIAVIGNDINPPTLALTGASTINIYQGDTYTDPGATATDDTDGDITSKIVVTNNVNTGTLGTYTVTYNVSDNAGNNATPITRTVNVLVSEFITSKGVNKPRLITGMTPIKWNGSSWVTTTESDTTWYDYTTTAKQWANAKTADGSMWVWIPRYAYQIATNYHTNTVGTISVKFLKNITNTASDNTTVDIVPTYSGSNQTNYITHQAFTFGTLEVTGIWVAKFEPNGSPANLSIIPSVGAMGNSSVDAYFTACRNLETNSKFGWGTTGNGLDTHLMKNIEWGVVSYLTRSTYGKTTEIYINNSASYTTGCSGNGTAATYTYGCAYLYSTPEGVGASTTGNIYGIYDMSGGTYEVTAAYINNGHANLTTYGASLYNAASRYKDVYTVTTDDQLTNYSNTANKKGDALYETSSSHTGANSWNTDNSQMPYLQTPFFWRGGDYGGTYGTGSFYFYFYNGSPTSGVGFRPVILIDPSL